LVIRGRNSPGSAIRRRSTQLRIGRTLATGHLAVIRSTTDATFTDSKTRKPATTASNSVAKYELHPGGAWKIEWSVVSGKPRRQLPQRQGLMGVS